MSDRAAIEVRGLFKRYGKRVALSGLDLDVRAGEIHGLLGPNGAGKTTLMRILLGVAVPDAGTVSLFGQRAGTAAGPALGGVAGFADTPQFYPYLSGRRNLRLLARLDGAGGRQAEIRVDEALDQVDLRQHADARVEGYSAGMRQRLGVAAALLRSPRLLVLDEPTNALDPAGALALRARVKRLAAEGAAILWSSHDLAEVEGLCDAVTVIHRGRLVFSGPIGELRKLAPATALWLRSSDDAQALAVGGASPGLQISSGAEGLEVTGSEAATDQYVVALGRAGIAVRSLERRGHSLESLFLRLTQDGAKPQAADAPAGSIQGPLPRSPATVGGIADVFRAEWSKLLAQLKTWAVFAALLLGPFAFLVVAKLQSDLPEDTLFGRWVKQSGFALPLLVLGFAALWGFPALASVVGGDIFSAEDRYRTWPTLLTRSRTRGEIFAGKILAALAFSLLALCLLGAGSLTAGLLLVGNQPLVGLSGTALPAGQAFWLVVLAWLSEVPPVFAFTALAILLSSASRSSAAGIGLPVLIGLLAELISLVNGPAVIWRLLPTPPFVAWHGLFTSPRFHGPLEQGTATSLAYFVGGLVLADLVLRRRERRG